MDSKAIFMVLNFVLFLAACAENPAFKSEYIIGDPLESLALSSSSSSASRNRVALYDETTNRIHEFDLDQKSHIRSFPVANSGSKHTVLYGSEGQYVISLSNKSVSIFTSAKSHPESPLQLIGTPKSAAFREDLGWLIVYDDLMSVGVVRLTASGQALSSWVGGPVIQKPRTITAGDLDNQGRLILALSDGSLKIIDLTQSLAKREWVFQDVPLTFNDTKWMAPVRGSMHLIMIVSEKKVYLVDIDQSLVIDTMPLPDGSIGGYSKSLDPHIVWYGKSNETHLIYTEDSVLVSTSMRHLSQSLIRSRLDLIQDIWITAEGKKTGAVLFNFKDTPPLPRTIKQWRVSDLLAQGSREISGRGEIALGFRSVFNLLPSPLGFAVNYDIATARQDEIRNFNIKHIK